MKKTTLTIIFIVILLTGVSVSESEIPVNKKDELIRTTAREIIDASKYCNLISMGEDGYPNARIMDPFKPDKDWVIWMGTNSHSRKVNEIVKNKKITLFYESAGGNGYVSLKGTGHINNDKENKVKYFKKGWKEFYPDDRNNFTLIKFITEKIEIVCYKNGLLGEKITWAAPSIQLNKK